MKYYRPRFDYCLFLLIVVCGGCSNSGGTIKPDEVGSKELPPLPDEWKEYYFKQDKCKIYVPRNNLTGTGDTIGKGVVRDFIRARNDKFALLIEFTHGLDLSHLGETEDEILDASSQQTANAEDKRDPARVKSVRDITLFGHPGREIILIQHDGQSHRKIWLVHIKDVKLQMNFICDPNDKHAMAKRKAFFESIRFAEK